MNTPENANARRQPGERATLTNCARSVAPVSPRIKLISLVSRQISARKQSASQLRSERNGESFGTPELCTWPVGPGTCRFQTRRPDFARKLSQRSGTRLVAWSVTGGYLRVFQEPIKPWRARNLVERYLAPTNGAFLLTLCHRTRRKQAGGKDSGRIWKGRS